MGDPEASGIPPAKFKEGEKILCFHGPLMYEAKVQKLEENEALRRRRYFIHYHGWSKNWDEWVLEPRMLKYNEANLLKKKELVRAHEAKRRSSKKNKRKLPSEADENEEADAKVSKSDAPQEPSSQKVDEGSKEENVTDNEKELRSESTVQSEEHYQSKVEIRIKIPEELKPYLVDDWDYLTRQRKLVILPCRLNVDQIIQDYVKSKSGQSKAASKNNRESAISEVMNGLKEYFNVMLGSQLLYKFEREQHADILREHGDSTPMSKIYGAIHLLRLFVKLGGMIAYTLLDEKSIQLLTYYIHDFLAYMKKNASTLFMITDYGTASPEYHRRSL
uniref:Mortality factor 4-like protein 1 n=2 Tax=Caligus rogercresseyi TaxID=217165 RepID=C1BRJ0_CALRO|nr:Mortality factor 4-like protein 1 [Caligus rogercresseyi]|eukprot:TRINITY_DN4898_c0_g1_i1.p1 TRINITY_DN4898_c0_g1~~TRINITY_DN4898_c0_g1_i1.p1  ORF type:complete len:333 (-),score=96.59 TRINITY_DN4898_c0_g1_i1:129-1127(-)